MKHEKIKELLPLYIDDELTVAEEDILANHLETCVECQKELKEYQKNQDLLSSLEQEKSPIDFSQSVMNRIKEDRPKTKSSTKNNSKSLFQKVKKFFTIPVKVPAGVLSLAAVILLVSITSLPGTLLNNLSKDNKLQSQNRTADYSAPNYKQNAQPRTSLEMDMAESSQQQNNPLANSSNATLEQKIIKRANLTIELKDITQIDSKVINLVEEAQGYISSSRDWINQDQQKFYRYVLRVPTAEFNTLLDQLSTKEYGQIISRSISSQDVTEEYMNLNIRLKNLSSQEEQYRKLLDKTTKVEEILKVENELNRIRTEIEKIEGRKKYLDKQISYSTITVEFRQPEPISSGAPGIVKAIRNAITTMVEEFYQIIILIGTIIPYLLVLALGYLSYKKFKRN